MPAFSLRDAVRLQTVSGATLDIGHRTLTPQSQTLSVRLDRHIGFVWSRPVAVYVDEDGQTRRIPIVDPTRVAQLVLAVSVLLFAVVLGVARHASPAHRSKQS